jgi:NADPH:quinone reductase-like Zn-dependent oxidoreductase
VAPDRVETIIDFAAAREHGTKMDGSMSASNAAVLAELAQLVARGELEVPIQAVYPLGQVKAAFRAVQRGHTLGKIVLVP